MTAPLGGIIDSHCHLDPDEYDGDHAAVIERAQAAGVSGLVAIGSGRDLKSARTAVELAARHPVVWATVGVHPHDVVGMNESDWSELETLARAPRVVGVGETGLDFHYDHSPRPVQREAFARFVALGRSSGLPVVVHVREAHDECADLLRAGGGGPGVIHCFTGGPDEARPYLDLGYCLSFSGIVTFKNAGPIREAARLCPAERLLVETDAPYLAPVPLRGRRNEPAHIVHTIEMLAKIRDASPAELVRLTAANARALFRLDSAAKSV
jgi:TatD DNase family protein